MQYVSRLGYAALPKQRLPHPLQCPGSRPARADVVARFDTDGDGKLDGDERRAAGAARAAVRRDSAGVGEDAVEKVGHHGGSKGANGKGRGRGRGKGKGANGHGGAKGANGHGGPRRTHGAGAGQAPSDDAVQVRDNAEGALFVDGVEPLDDGPGAGANGHGRTKGRNGRGARLGKNGRGHARGQARRAGSEREAAEAARADATRERAKTGNDGNIGRTPDARDRGKGGNDGNIGKPEQPSPRKSDGGGKGGSRGESKGENSRGTRAGRR